MGNLIFVTNTNRNCRINMFFFCSFFGLFINGCVNKETKCFKIQHTFGKGVKCHSSAFDEFVFCCRWRKRKQFFLLFCCYLFVRRLCVLTLTCAKYSIQCERWKCNENASMNNKFLLSTTNSAHFGIQNE